MGRKGNAKIRKRKDTHEEKWQEKERIAKGKDMLRKGQEKEKDLEARAKEERKDKKAKVDFGEQVHANDERIFHE